jgi:5-methyltetrahydropteroyltriglutamate--homocysteine methyltransferase
MKRSSTHILTTHAGSLIRPAEIVEAMIQDHLREPLDKKKFDNDLKVAVEDVVKKQANIGIDVVDDGEFGKSSWIAYLADRFDGLVRVPLPREVLEAPSPVYGDFKRFSAFYRIYGQIESKLWLPDAPSKSRYDGNQTSEYAKAACVGPLRYKPEALQRDIANFKAALEDIQVEEAFLPVVAPASVEVIFNKYYKTAEE